MKLCLLASGSKGNSVFIESGDTRILVDAGCSGREISRRLEERGIDPATLDAILLTHEHADHLAGVGILSRRYKIPAYVSSGAVGAIARSCAKADLVEFESGSRFTFRDLQIDPFPVTHDAADPVGFTVESGEGKLGVATDLGIATRLVKDKLAGCRALVLESNHDEAMLLDGPYPWHLKQRIRSRYGHLSNAESVDLLRDVMHDRLEGLFLAHLSEVNNHPDKARSATVDYLGSQNVSHPRLIVGSQSQASELLSL